jgi:hypothetical protein
MPPPPFHFPPPMPPPTFPFPPPNPPQIIPPPKAYLNPGFLFAFLTGLHKVHQG